MKPTLAPTLNTTTEHTLATTTPAALYLTATIPVPTSVNGLYKWRKDGGVYLTEHGRVFKERAFWAIKKVAMHCAALAADDRLILVMTVHFKPGRRRDVDNILKASQDAVASALGIDDSIVDAVVAVRGEDSKAAPCCEVAIYRYQGAPLSPVAVGLILAEGV